MFYAHKKNLSKHGSFDAVSLNYDLLYSGMRRIKIKVKPNHREVFTYQSLFPTIQDSCFDITKETLKVPTLCFHKVLFWCENRT